MIKKIKYIFTILSTMMMGMAGGQKNVSKGVRRFGIPGLASVMAFFSKNKKKAWIFFLLIPILCMGYGESSFLMSLVNSDWGVRVLYGFLVSLPFIFFGIKKWLWTAISLVIAFSVRAGSLVTIGTFDFLIEDMLRDGTLGFFIALNTIKGE